MQIVQFLQEMQLVFVASMFSPFSVSSAVLAVFDPKWGNLDLPVTVNLQFTRIQQEVPSKAVLEQEMVWMKEHLSTLGSPVVLCHNDLLCKNIIHNSKEGHVRFIDYEYSSYNYQAFDIGNHFNEFAGMAELDYGLYPSREMQMDWLEEYLQAYKLFTKKTEEVSQRELETLYVQVNKFALASHFFWGFWALIQAKYSSIDFDFLGYAVLRFNQYFKIKPTVMALQIPE
ncbi:Ethanolamine kinase 1 [Xenotaenia resolanae]|uniref:ethanolamine kinase n=1 Tax=Xenotaenia resolanae TaxID=208358 RepID=A0ABV0VY70_9TELE